MILICMFLLKSLFVGKRLLAAISTFEDLGEGVGRGISSILGRGDLNFQHMIKVKHSSFTVFVREAGSLTIYMTMLKDFFF